jgi:hypothetical protein
LSFTPKSQDGIFVIFIQVAESKPHGPKKDGFSTGQAQKLGNPSPLDQISKSKLQKTPGKDQAWWLMPRIPAA